MCFYLSVFHHWNITFFYFWNAHVWSLFPSNYHEKIKSKNKKKHSIIVVFEKVTQLVARKLVTIRKKNKIVKLKPQHWRILIIWKRSNKIKVVNAGGTLKVSCHWKSQISELLDSSLKILSFRNKFECVCFDILCESKKIDHQAHKNMFKFSKITFQKLLIFQYRIRSNTMFYTWIDKSINF